MWYSHKSIDEESLSFSDQNSNQRYQLSINEMKIPLTMFTFYLLCSFSGTTEIGLWLLFIKFFFIKIYFQLHDVNFIYLVERLRTFSTNRTGHIR